VTSGLQVRHVTVKTTEPHFFLLTLAQKLNPVSVQNVYNPNKNVK